MTTPENTHELRESGRPGGDPPGTVEVHASGALATEPAGSAAVQTAGAGGGPDVPRAEAPTSRRRRRPLRTSLIVLVAIVVAAAAGLAATGALGGGGDDGTSAAPTGPSATAKVRRTTLTDTETVDGNIGYGEATTVQATAAGSGSSAGSGQGGGGGSGGSGILTWLPAAGATIERGENVYSVDQQKTPLLYGSIPFFRTMRPGDSGTDVKILEQNLKALGYDGFTADSTYTADTAAAVEEWQHDLNREETGTVAPGDAVVAAGARKVAEVKASTGVAPSGTVLSWTATERVVTVDLDAQYEDLVKVGTKAQITLPDGTTVEGTVTDVGTPSNVSDDDSAGSGGSGSSDSDKAATLPVELKVKNQKGLGNYQAAAVDVTLKSQSRENVLAVPVNALVARSGGGYALEVVKPSAPHGVEYVPVKLGMFADSLVEVSGAGITEGTVVGVAK